MNPRDADHRDLKVAPDGIGTTIASYLLLLLFYYFIF